MIETQLKNFWIMFFLPYFYRTHCRRSSVSRSSRTRRWPANGCSSTSTRWSDPSREGNRRSTIVALARLTVSPYRYRISSPVSPTTFIIPYRIPFIVTVSLSIVYRAPLQYPFLVTVCVIVSRVRCPVLYRASHSLRLFQR